MEDDIMILQQRRLIDLTKCQWVVGWWMWRYNQILANMSNRLARAWISGTSKDYAEILHFYGIHLLFDISVILSSSLKFEEDPISGC